MTALAVQASFRPTIEPGSEAFVFWRAASSPPDLRRATDIFDSNDHGSPLAPVCCGIDAHQRATTTHPSAAKGIV